MVLLERKGLRQQPELRQSPLLQVQVLPRMVKPWVAVHTEDPVEIETSATAS